MSHTPALDLSRYDLLEAKNKLFAHVCDKAESWGVDPRRFWKDEISVRRTQKGGTCLMSQCGCDKCWSSEASKAWQAVTSIDIEEYLIDESHYIVSIRSCPSCSQRYLQVTTETVDWKDGEDPIFRTIIPIDDEERAGMIANSPPKTSVLEAIGPGRRSLKYAWQKGEEPSTYRGTGVQVGLHD